MRVVQLSDCHLLSDPDLLFKGVNPAQHVQEALNHIARLQPSADLLVLTGDLAHDERVETYRWLKAQLNQTSIPFCLVPGNHDSPTLMDDEFGPQGGNPYGGFVIHRNGWSFLGLSTHRPNREEGYLGERQLSWCQSHLQALGETPTLVFMHHPPVAVGSPWIDRIGLHDSAAFAQCLIDAPQVKGIFCGHVHQPFAGLIGQTPVYTTPSTAVQFRPNTDVPQLTEERPAYRIIDLGKDAMQTETRSWCETSPVS